MRSYRAALVACCGTLAILGLPGCSPSPSKPPVVGDPGAIANEFATAADSAADFISTVRDKKTAVREEGKVNRLLAGVLLKRAPYDALVLDDGKPAGRTGAKVGIPADVKARADQAAERFERELMRFERLLGTQQTGK